MRRGRILVVEDDAKTAATLRLYLEHEGFRVETVHDGVAGLARARRGDVDAVILDLMLPGLDGREVCRRLRRDSSVPVLMVTARATEEDRIDGLDLGADDYITKPFSPREVVARLRAALRRVEPGGPRRRIRSAGLEMNLESQEVTVDGEAVQLTPTEFAVLRTLAAAPGRVFSRSTLARQALGARFDGSDRTVDAHVKNLRRKIERDRARPRFVGTVFGVGYKFLGGPEDDLA